MPMLMKERAEDVVAGWRAGDQPLEMSSPAGPLFPSGEYAEHELTMTGHSGKCGTVCTYSQGRQCC